ncbi:MAG: hypothetical protein ACLR8Y_06695 [Alistipes indistinctus]
MIYLFRFIYRIRWWLLIGPVLAALFVIYKTQKMSHTYQTRTTIYTGAVSVTASPDDSGNRIGPRPTARWTTWSTSSCRRVRSATSRCAFAQAMMYGSPTKNTNYISAGNYRALMRHVPMRWSR